MRPTRKSIAVLCVALVVFSAFVPAAAPQLVQAILVPLWVVVPDAAFAVIRREATCCDEQPTALLSLVLSRAPPRPAALA